MATKPQPRYQKGDRIGGRYQVHKALMGGMGEVYLCLDLETNYPYALKTFQQRFVTDMPRLRHAFDREVATWIALEKHPNIVRCFWMEILDNQPFIVLEWIAGEEGKGTDLRGWLRRSQLDLKFALGIAIDICRGLIHAQEKQPGLVHRDLKPENILVEQGSIAKITDFGLAEVIEEAGLEVEADAVDISGRQSSIGGQGIVGTPAYMPPEQWRGEVLDERTDIYALGCILYEMVTGTSPFTVDFIPSTPQQVQEWLRAMQEKHERHYPRLPNKLPMVLHDLLQSALSKARCERPASLSVLLRRLNDIYQQLIGQLPPSRSAPDIFSAGDYNNRGVTYADLRDHKAALVDYNRSIDLDPNYAIAYSNRGLTYTDLQDYQAALADYDRSVALDPTYAIGYYNRGLSYAALQDYHAALADFSRALALDPNLAKAYYNRGITYEALRDHQAALGDYSCALDLDPNYTMAYYNLGALLANHGQLHKALPYLEKAGQLGLHQSTEAVVQIRQMLGLDPTPKLNHAQEASVAFAEADYPGAMQRASDLFPLLVSGDFIAAIEQTIAQLPSEQRSALEQRLAWLRQIAGKQSPRSSQ